ncbi:MAG: pyridoxal-dependent decarboxylase [Pseudobdellovibrionaceae bacterium]
MSEAARSREILFQTELFEIVSIVWTENSVSQMHAHGWSACLVLIEEGEFENKLDMGVKCETKKYSAGQVVSTPVGAHHELKCVSARGKTLHVYTPKINVLESGGRFHPGIQNELNRDLSLGTAINADDLRDVLKRAQESAISTESPYFMNQLFSGVIPQMLIAEEFIARTKTTLATSEASPVHSRMEEEVVGRLCRRIGWGSESSRGITVPGGSAANIMALHCARHRTFPSMKVHGHYHSPMKIFVSENAHYSFKKACAVLGLGLHCVVSVATDAEGRMVPEVLREKIEACLRAGEIPLMVVATAGTTVHGAFDPIRPLAEICWRYNIWLHVDGAWGGPVLFSRKLAGLIDGIELADSLTFDAHKLFGASLTCSFFLTKHKEILLQANDVSGADYLFHENDSLDRGRLSWQCGRSADAVSFWTIWKSLGDEGLGEFVDRQVSLRDETVKWIEGQPRLEIVARPSYLNLCVRILAPDGRRLPEWSRFVRERMKASDLCLVNYSSDSQGTFLRLILAHPFLTTAHLRQILEWALSIGVDQ